jgi:hypothetical protein
VQITERDRRLLAFAAEQRFVLAAHIGALLGISRAAASTRLRALSAGGYLSSARPLQDEPPLFLVTRAGLQAAGSSLPPPRRVDLSTYRHEAGVAWLTVAAERGMFGPLAEVVSERRMRSLDRRAGDRGQPFGVRLGKVGRDGRQQLHYPDLVLLTDTGHRVAFELELTTKTPRRRERILAAYAAERRIDAVIYLVDDPARRRAMEESVRRVGIGDRVRVEQLTLGHHPHPPAPPARGARRIAHPEHATKDRAR